MGHFKPFENDPYYPHQFKGGKLNYGAHINSTVDMGHN